MRYTVTYKRYIPGRVTVFDFEEEHFERNVVKLFCSIQEHPRADDLQDIFQNFSLLKEREKDSALQCFSHHTKLDRIILTEHQKLYPNETDYADKYRLATKLLRKAGFIGYEYKGGVVTGGSIRHRAFCLWDNDFVNAAKVDVVR